MNLSEKKDRFKKLATISLGRLSRVFTTGDIMASRPHCFMILLGHQPSFNLRIFSLKKGVYSLQIDDGVFDFIHDYLRVVLSDNSLFPDNGRSSGIIKIPSAQLIQGNLSHDYLSNAIIESEYNNPVYFDEARTNLHKSLFEFIIQILIGHEYFHMYNGHLDFMFLVKEITEYNEGRDVLKIAPLDSQTMEMDADSSILCFCYDFLCGNYDKKLHHSEIGINQRPNLNSTEDIIYYLLFSCYFLLRFTNQKSINNVDSMKASSHPIPLMRFQFFVNTLYQKVMLTKPALASYVLICMTRILEEIEQTLAKVVEIESSFKIEMDQQQFLDHSGEVISNWNNLLPILSQFAYGKTAK